MNVFELIKNSITIEEVAREHGIEINPNGKAICPFHEEKVPSFSLHPGGLFAKRFGCGVVADVIELEYRLGSHGSRWEGARALNDRYHLGLKFHGFDKEKAEDINSALELLDWYCNRTHETLLENEEALKWLETHKGITLEDIKEYRIGYVGHGWVKDELDGAKRNLALRIGLLKEKDSDIYDAFWNRIIFPVWNSGRIASIWTREFPYDEDSSFKWLGLPNSELIPHKPIAFGENLNCEICVVTESISDAIAFLKAGIPACSPIGTEVSRENRACFEKAGAKLYFAFDPDEPGRNAAYRLAKEFKGYIADLGRDKDPDEVLAELGVEEFKKLMEKALNEAKYYMDMVIEKEGIRESLEEIAGFEMETEREIWLHKLADRHRDKKITLAALRADLSTVQREIQRKERIRMEQEEAKRASEPQDPLSEYTEEEIAKAREILKSSDILGEVIKITERAGYVGEERNKKLTFLALTSRKSPGRKKAISLTPKGESSSGKSDLIKTMLRLIPPQDWKEFTYVTEKALLHAKLDLSHRILCIFEREGGRQADYTIRTAQSEEKLKILITVKDPQTGGFEAVEKEIPAEGMVYIETTTQEHIEQQNANRTFEFFTDSSPELTRQVLMSQARNQILDEESLEQECRIWRCVQVLLQPLQVFIPFSEELGRRFPVEQVRARRDFPRLLALIEASALLHQEQRKKYESEGTTIILASVEDFDTAYEIISPILSQVYKQLSPREEALARVIKEEYGFGQFADPPDNPVDKSAFGVQELLERIKERCQTKTDNSARDFKAYNTLRKYLKKLVGRGILEWNEGKGVKSKYILVNDISHIPFDISLDEWAASQEDDSFDENPPDMMDEDFSLIADGPMAEDKTISYTLDTEGRGSSFPYKSLENSGIRPLDIDNTEGSMKTTLYEEYQHGEVCECESCLGGLSNFEEESGQFEEESNEG